MTDREKLIERAKAEQLHLGTYMGLGPIGLAALLDDLITALSAPERPVPTLPEGYEIKGPSAEMFSLIYNGRCQVKVDEGGYFGMFLSAFLPKSPLDELAAQAQELNMGYSPAEPVQAAGDGADAEAKRAAYRQDVDDEIALDLGFYRGIAPASPSDQGQDQSAPMKQDDTEAQRQSWLRGEMAMGESVAGVAQEAKPLTASRSCIHAWAVVGDEWECKWCGVVRQIDYPETAKPERESLEQAFKTKFGVPLSEWMTGGYTPAGAEVVGWIIRIMDQNKLDERGA